MNLPTLIVLLLVLAALVLALRVLRRSGGGNNCGCGSAGSCSGTCTGCPHCQGK